ncbi:senescence associated protein [Echinococcus multilocularis]|uniref:Senescence associated protein n=1 Tax=Echinococcus multilocularis TaxID=6211 RepID=A0A0S4MJY2_ECHMU|nr:senescence associated protein [Echinococcus multilocularis]
MHVVVVHALASHYQPDHPRTRQHSSCARRKPANGKCYSCLTMWQAAVYRCTSGRDSDLEAFSLNPPDGSLAPLADRPGTYRVARRTHTPTDNTTVHPPAAPAAAAAAAADSGQPAATEDAVTSELAVWRQTSTPRLDDAGRPASQPASQPDRQTAVVATPRTALHADSSSSSSSVNHPPTDQSAEAHVQLGPPTVHPTHLQPPGGRVQLHTPHACLTQPSEPILFPRLRIKYADFPYLHYSSARGSSPWRPDADMGTACHENNTASLGFSRAYKSLPDTTGEVVLYGGDTPISGQPDSRGNNRPYKEKRTLPGTPADVSEFVCVTAPDGAARVERTTDRPTDRPTPPISVSRVENVNPIPFRSGGLPTYNTTPMRPHARTHALMQGTPRLCTESPDRLGPPDPWPTAVPMEPFSTSALKVLT